MKNLIYLFSFLLFVFSLPAQAGKVMKVKGQKVYILFDQDEPFTTGDYFLLTNDAGKKVGLVQIKKIKGLKAVGALKKGKADKGFATLFKSAGKKSKSSSSVVMAEDADAESRSNADGQSRMGVLVGYGMASQEVDQGGSGISNQDGSSMAVRGVYDYPLFESVFFRGMAGAEIFSVSGPGSPISAPSTTTTIGTDITYLSLDALFHWSVMKGSTFNAYLIGGMGILYPLSKSSEAILEDSIDSLAIGEFGGGVEMRWGTYTLPLEVTYYYFPSGEDVNTSVISVKLGVLF
jgi:hypothetical protein